LNDGEGFGFREDCGEAVWLFGAEYVGGKFDLFEEDVTVEEEDGAECLTSTGSVQGFCVEAATFRSVARCVMKA
jgi:hypothetical protein